MTNATLTLTATGDAQRIRTHDTETMSVTETVPVDITTEAEIDAEWLDDVGSVYKQGMVLPPADVAHHIVDSLDNDELLKATNGKRWDITMSGSVDEFQKVAVRAAKARRSASAPQSRIITTAAHVLESLHEFEGGSDRALLALLDLVQSYEVDKFTVSSVVASIGGSGEVDAPEVAGDD